jgi:hypothetical protein
MKPVLLPDSPTRGLAVLLIVAAFLRSAIQSLDIPVLDALRIPDYTSRR